MSADIKLASQGLADRYMKALRPLVEIETPTGDRAGAERFLSHLEARLAGEGWQSERVRQEAVGDHLIARLDAPGEVKTLFLAHYDTVWPVGTLHKMPFRLEEGKAYGPGILDMKGGINTSLFAITLVRELKLELRGPITLLVTSDEETGSHSSRALIERLAKEHDRVLVAEPGRDDGAYKVGRKGTGSFTVQLEGVSAHAGNNPQDGASALRELSHFLFFAEGLTDDLKGTTVNLTIAQGGGVSNVIAETASATLDVRTLTMDEAKRVTEALRTYSPQDSRVKVKVLGDINRPPLEFTAKNKAFFNEAVVCGATMNLPVSGSVVGGGSDGNFTSALGIPTLDGVGAVGAGPHARHEHIRIADTVERIAVLVCLLTT